MLKSAVTQILCIDFLNEKLIRFKIVGGASNILFSDDGFRGVIIKTLRLSGIKISGVSISADCGVKFSRLLALAARQGLGGASGLFGIPGTVGGMVYSNAGAFGTEVSDVVKSAIVYSPRDKKLITLSKEDMKFSYRSSVFKDSGLVILSCALELSRVDFFNEQNNFKKVILKRKSNQPYGEKSLGSVFKRCSDISVSKLIDNLGFKGESIGDAEVSACHAGFIVNKGKATAEDYKLLCEKIRSKIYSVYGFYPPYEIEIL